MTTTSELALVNGVFNLGVGNFSIETVCLYATIYSVLVFSGELFKDGRRVFSQRNIKSPIEVVSIHGLFLMAMCGILKLSSRIEPALPSWLSKNLGNGTTLYSLMFLVVLIAIQALERRYIYSERDPGRE